MCRAITKREYISTAIVIIAALMIAFDPSAKKVGHASNYKVSLACLLFNIPAALFWYYSKRINELNFDIRFQFTVQITLMIIFYSALTVIFEGSKFDFSDLGLFGGLRRDNLPLNILNAIMCGFWGVLGY